ncbi:MAG: hypothetical protein QXS20_07655 [Candidatus Thorarchaeota archaeon]
MTTEAMATRGSADAVLLSLSPAAQSLMKHLLSIEQGASPDLFEDDPYNRRLEMMCLTTRGSLYSQILETIRESLSRGHVSIVTQHDVQFIAEWIWRSNISRLSSIEILCIGNLVREPTMSLSNLSERTGVAYGRIRRAYNRLTQSGVLRKRGLLRYDAMGLERILAVLEEPAFVLQSEFIEHTLFVDGPVSLVLLVITCPMDKRSAVIDYLRALRSSASNVTMWRLAEGKTRFSPLYYRAQPLSWAPDLLHFRIALRGGDSKLVLAPDSMPMSVSPSLSTSELRVIDMMRTNFDATASQISSVSGLSRSAVFRIRRSVLTRGLLVPRITVDIPLLSERVVAMIPADRAGDVLPAWFHLPLTYASRITNIEDTSDQRAILTTALPAGAGRAVVDALRSELNLNRALSAHVVSSGSERRMPLSLLFDRKRKESAWSHGDILDVCSYAVARQEARRDTAPLDLA